MTTTSAAQPVPGSVSRGQFISELGEACARRRPYAAGKLGPTQRSWLAYPVVLSRERNPTRLKAYELVLGHRGLKSCGIFPTRPEFLAEWSARFVQDVAALDSIGVFPDAVEDTLSLLRYHGIDRARTIHFKDQQPDHSRRSAAARSCYLPFFAGLDLLLICPFAAFLADRANRETFEKVWAKTGQRWFEPRSVQALELPYGFLPGTQVQYETALDLLEAVERELAERTYDVALIAAGGLGIPLAVSVRRQGRVGIALGGDLQVLFGVLGERWRGNQDWQQHYINDSWVDLPERYVPARGLSTENYW